MTKRTLHIYRRVMCLKVRVCFRQLHWRYIGEQEGREVSIDLKGLVQPGRTYIHECLHVLYPDMTERNVLILERETWKDLGRKEILAIYRRMFR